MFGFGPSRDAIDGDTSGRHRSIRYKARHAVKDDLLTNHGRVDWRLQIRIVWNRWRATCCKRNIVMHISDLTSQLVTKNLSSSFKDKVN